MNDLRAALDRVVALTGDWDPMLHPASEWAEAIRQARAALHAEFRADLRWRSDLIDAIALGLHKTRPSNDAPEFSMEKADERAEAIWDYVQPVLDARAALNSDTSADQGPDLRQAAIERAVVDLTSAYHAERKHDGKWDRCQRPRCQNARLALAGRGPLAALAASTHLHADTGEAR